MITVRDVDRLVVSDDTIAARVWPRLGARVREAYTSDRDAWVALRRRAEGGKTLQQADLATQQSTFVGWARAFRAAGQPKPARPTAKRIVRTVAASPRAVAAPPPAPVTTRSLSLPPVASSTRGATTAPPTKVGPGPAIAGAVVLAGLIALAARRRNA